MKKNSETEYYFQNVKQKQQKICIIVTTDLFYGKLQLQRLKLFHHSFFCTYLACFIFWSVLIEQFFTYIVANTECLSEISSNEFGHLLIFT